MLCVFFFKQKTEYEMRISDWSSDVCSSDLTGRDVDRGRTGKGDRLGDVLGRQPAGQHPGQRPGRPCQNSPVEGHGVATRQGARHGRRRLGIQQPAAGAAEEGLCRPAVPLPPHLPPLPPRPPAPAPPPPHPPPPPPPPHPPP